MRATLEGVVQHVEFVPEGEKRADGYKPAARTDVQLLQNGQGKSVLVRVQFPATSKQPVPEKGKPVKLSVWVRAWMFNGKAGIKAVAD